MGIRFSVEDALDASESGEPIVLSRGDALRIVRAHGASEELFFAEVGPLGSGVGLYSDAERWDAAAVLVWLGY